MQSTLQTQSLWGLQGGPSYCGPANELSFGPDNDSSSIDVGYCL